MYYRKTCKSCGDDFKVEDSDAYEDDSDYSLMVDRSLCYSCLIDVEQAEQAKDMTEFLDSLSEKQRDLFVKVLQNIYGPRTMMKDLVETHFQGYEGIRSWGLW